MKRFAITTLATLARLKTWGAILILGGVAEAGMPYLPRLGPPPMRLSKVTTRTAITTFKYVAPLATNNLATVAATKDAAVVTNGTNLTPTVSAPTDDQVLGDAFSASVFSLPAPDLLGISPDMLATYFRPVRTGTNSAELIGPFHVSFTPPVAPDRSSHAQYIVK